MKIIDERIKIKSLINRSNDIYLMGHKDLDLDAIGGLIAMYLYCNSLGKRCFIINDSKRIESSTKRVIESWKNKVTFCTTSNSIRKAKNKDLLIVMDTNRKLLVHNDKILDVFKNIMVIDHHDVSTDEISANVNVIDTDTSSICEMMSFFLLYNKFDISCDLSTILLAGIVMDTNSYVLKTTKETFRISSRLTDLGANPKDVQYLLKSDINDYIESQKVIINTKIINKVAITKGSQKSKYRREDLAKIADTLLLFSGIESSFVVGYLEKSVVGVSARSLGTIDVGKILSKFNGGGDNYEAATKISDTTISKVETNIINYIKNL